MSTEYDNLYSTVDIQLVKKEMEEACMPIAEKYGVSFNIEVTNVDQSFQ